MLKRLLRIARYSGREVLMLFYAFRNPATPVAVKLLTVALGVYLLSPIDLVPDFVPVLGWLDDVTLLAFGVPLLLSRLSPAVTRQASQSAGRLLGRLAFWRRRRA